MSIDINPSNKVTIDESNVTVAKSGTADSSGFVQKNVTGNLTVGHTTDIDSIGEIAAAGTYAPDTATAHIKEGTVAGSFTLARPAANVGYPCNIELTVTGAGGYTMSTTNIDIISGSFVGTAGTVNLIQFNHRGTSKNADIIIGQRP